MTWRGSLAVQVLEEFGAVSIMEKQRWAHEDWSRWRAERAALYERPRRRVRPKKGPRPRKDPAALRAGRRERSRRHYAANVETINAKRRARYAAKRDERCARRRAWRRENVDAVRAKERERAQRYMARTTYMRAYYVANRERLKAAARARYQARKAE